MGVKGYKNVMFIGIVFLVLSNPISAEEILSAEEVKKLYTNKTFDGENIIKDEKYRAYSSEDGTLKVEYTNGQSIILEWQVDNKGRHCVAKRWAKQEKCSKIVSAGDGVYKKITNGRHVHTMRNFVEGDQL